ncbi:HoxN/HupN/NixA family nickel/cobalt transporter [Caedibacter taeniospiralis]|jgi:high-affinity nickel-transport protein|uniref:HoxN/HupN/NixA family nickel/cobalt transporter n=1 Tax=Caedibacter taeniospiralis TaxID=28907 RepID=UPI0037BF377C
MYQKFFRHFIAISLIVWAIFALLFYQHLNLLAIVFIAFILGLRHGFDVDHIVAIDNVTRQLAANAKPSVTTGLFFALGHSSVVFLLTLLVILGVSLTKAEDLGIIGIGAMIGSIVSIVFLWLTGGMNLISLYRLVKHQQNIHAHSPLTRWFKSLFTLVDKPYKMYPVGFLFGLGFDTATEIALLGLAATASLSGESIWLILSLPIAFALGMTWVDSLDALLMTRLINSQNVNDQLFRRYNIAILLIVITASFAVGLIQLLGLIKLDVDGVVSFIGDHSPWFGASLVLIMLVVFVSMILKKRY